MESGPEQLGKLFLLSGVILAGLGGVMLLLGKIGFFRLPGDIAFGSKGWRIFIPITSCVIISLLFTAILWIINLLRR